MQEWKVQKTASKGYAIGPAFVVKPQKIEVDKTQITAGQEAAETKRFEAAVAKAKADLSVLAAKDDIFAGHLALTGDVALYDGVIGRIKAKQRNAEMALIETQDEYVAVFESMDDEYMRERAADMKDVAKRLLYALKGIEDNSFAAMKEKGIVVAEDLTPSDTAKMNMELVLGFITEEGGVTSHVSIIAKNMAIPCLVGVGEIMREVADGEQLIMDASAGEIFIKPDEALILAYQKKQTDFMAMQKEMKDLSRLPSVTMDGHAFELAANVGNLEDIKQAIKHQIDGIGLFRSEFLYMESRQFPTEEAQYDVYRQAAELLEGRELTIRTLDIGGDKGLDYFEFPREENPFLGYRAIRMCLDQSETFKVQLRAILRASVHGKIRIMYPMIISISELRAANEILNECKAELKNESIEYDENIQVGMMIETPAAVWQAEDFAKHVDFFSIGTNDLTQYILAVDRGNKKVAQLYDSFHPAVLRAIHHTIQAGHQAKIKVGMCGEFASDERAVRLLLGMGLDEFSMSATEIARVKYELRACEQGAAAKLAAAVLQLETAAAVKELITEQGV